MKFGLCVLLASLLLGCSHKEEGDRFHPYTTRVEKSFVFSPIEDIVLEESDSVFIGRIRAFFIGTDGKMYVGDMIDNSVKVYSSTGRLLGVIGKKGKGPGEVVQMSGVCSDDSGNVYISDSVLRRITVFDATGKYVRGWSTPKRFLHASGGLSYAHGKIFVEPLNGFTTPRELHMVKSLVTAMGVEGNEVASYGKFDPIFKELFLPAIRNYFTVDSNGSVYVITDHSSVVQKYSSEGNLMRRFTFPTPHYRPTVSSYPLGSIQQVKDWGNTLTYTGRIASHGKLIFCSFINFTERYDKTLNMGDAEHFLQVFDTDGNNLVEYWRVPGEFLGIDRKGLLYFNTRDEPGNRMVSKWSVAIR